MVRVCAIHRFFIRPPYVVYEYRSSVRLPQPIDMMMDTCSTPFKMRVGSRHERSPQGHDAVAQDGRPS